MIIVNPNCIKIIFLSIVCTFYSSTCIANGLPISDMNCSKLIERTNTILSLGGQNFCCSEPIFRKISSNEKVFFCYIDKQSLYRPSNGLIMLYESTDGKTINIGITFEASDKRKSLQTMLVISSIMLACGLTTNEATQLISSLNQVNGARQYGHIWSKKLNRYYILAFNKIEDGILSALLVATDRI